MWLRVLPLLVLGLSGLQACVGTATLETSPRVLDLSNGSASDGLLPGSDRQPQGVHACPVESMSCYPGCAVVGDTYACGKTLLEISGGLSAAIEAIAIHEGMSLEDFCGKYEILCTKGGKQNIDNEYVRAAKELPKGVDPCEWLKALYREAIESDDTAKMLKLKRAQKAMGCRPNANDF
jgi:hypothetical protein